MTELKIPDKKSVHFNTWIKKYGIERAIELNNDYIKKIKVKKSEEHKKSMSKEGKHVGSKNNMYGISLYDTWLNKYGKEIADQKMAECSAKKSAKVKGKSNSKFGNHGSKNPMYGRSLYSVWFEKYGREEADRRQKELTRKRSAQRSGSGNPMYGKSPGKQAGVGLSGFYNSNRGKVHFRSLHELSYIVKIFERFNLTWEPAEKFRIKGMADNKPITYVPDFLVSNTYLLEIKPPKMMSIKINLIKKQIAEEYCKTKNWKYKVTSCSLLSVDKLKNMYNNNLLQISANKNKKFLQMIGL